MAPHSLATWKHIGGSIWELVQFGLLYPILWGNSPYAEIIFKVQKRAVRIVKNLASRESCRGCFKSLNLLTTAAVYIYECVKFVFKNRHYFSQFEPVHTYSTRHMNYNIPYHRLSFIERGALVSCIKFYNHLPAALKINVNFPVIKKPLTKLLMDLEPYTVSDFLSHRY